MRLWRNLISYSFHIQLYTFPQLSLLFKSQTTCTTVSIHLPLWSYFRYTDIDIPCTWRVLVSHCYCNCQSRFLIIQWSSVTFCRSVVHAGCSSGQHPLVNTPGQHLHIMFFTVPYVIVMLNHRAYELINTFSMDLIVLYLVIVRS